MFYVDVSWCFSVVGSLIGRVGCCVCLVCVIGFLFGCFLGVGFFSWMMVSVIGWFRCIDGCDLCVEY